ncbi:MAG: hypothetical protein AABX33_06800 [Nanoarchaeota archaeon]
MRELEKELEGLPENFIVGIVMPNDTYEDANMHLLSFLINRKKATGGYLSISKPSNYIISLLKNNNINADSLFFIDCITKGLGAELPQQGNCVFIESPSHLTDLGIAVHKFFTSEGDKNKFLYIDSISTLCIHNKLENVLKFIHNITGKMRVFGFNGIILSLHEETDKRVISELGQFCDKVIHL